MSKHVFLGSNPGEVEFFFSPYVYVCVETRFWGSNPGEASSFFLLSRECRGCCVVVLTFICGMFFLVQISLHGGQ